MVEHGAVGAEERDRHIPHIGVAYAGGTISSIQTKFGYREGGHVRDLVGILQDTHPTFVSGRFTIGQPRVVFTGLSENIIEENRIHLDDTLEEMVDSGEYDAIIVPHGTDSFGLTAQHTNRRVSLIRKVIARGMKIIFTAAEDDIDVPNTDAWDNLMDSFDAAIDPTLEPGVYGSFHKRIIPAEYIVKQPYLGPGRFNFMDSRSEEYAQALAASLNRSIEIADRLYQYLHGGKSIADLVTDEQFGQVLKAIQDGTFTSFDSFLKPATPLTDEELAAEFANMNVMQDPLHRVFEYRVDLDRPNHFDMAMALKEIWLFPEARATLLTLYHSGTANTIDSNSAVTTIVSGLRERRGMALFAVTETGEPVDLHAYETSVALREAGLIPLYDMPKDAAMVKLWWATEQTNNPVELIDLMLRNLVGEIDENRIHREDIDKLKKLYQDSWAPIQQAYTQRAPESIFWESWFRR